MKYSYYKIKLNIAIPIFVFAYSLSGSVFAHPGGVDAKGCHSKKNVRHCHGDNSGKYLPENEATRIKKLHTTTCNTLLPEGGYPKQDLYGKRCNRRN